MAAGRSRACISARDSLELNMWARLLVVGRMRGVMAASHAVYPSRLIVTISLGLSLAACAVGPDFVSPAAPLADNFTAANDRSLRTDRQDYRDWWRAFRDPTLN